jgi:hypothetical protein
MGFWVMTGSLVMTSWLPVLLFQLYVQTWAAAAVVAILPAVLLYPWYGSVGRALLAPFGIYAFLLIALNALFRTTFGIPMQWKGRAV